MLTKEQHLDNAAMSIRKVLASVFADLAIDLDEGSILQDAEIDVLFNKLYMKIGIEPRVRLYTGVWVEDIILGAKQAVETAIRDKVKNAMKGR